MDRNEYSSGSYSSNCKHATKDVDFTIDGNFERKNAIKVFKSYPQLKKKPYWGNHFWAKGYCADTIGLDEDKIKKCVKYRENQDRLEEQQRLDFGPGAFTSPPS